MSRPKVFYGYWVLACCFVFSLISIGCGNIAFSLFVRILQEALGWSRTEIMGGFTVIIVIGALASPPFGRLVERYGARAVVVGGTLMAAVGFVVLSRMTHLWQFYLAYVLIGTGFTATGPLTSTYVVSHWFREKRGQALGIMAMGIGSSAILFPPFIAVYLLPRFGWRHTYLTFGAISMGILIPLGLFVLRTKPADMGLQPDGIDASPAKKGSLDADERKVHSHEGLSLKSALATSAFWMIGISLFFDHSHLGVLQSIFPHFRDIGFSPGVAATTISAYGAAFTAGTFFFGWLCDKVPAKVASALGMSLIAIGIMVLLSIGPRSSMVAVYLYSVIMGLGVGSWLSTMSMLTSTTFGMASYGAIFGTLTMFQSAGAAVGPLIAGYVYDVARSYFWGFSIILAMVIVAIPLVLLVREPVKRQTHRG